MSEDTNVATNKDSSTTLADKAVDLVEKTRTNEWMEDVLNRMNALVGKPQLNITHVMPGVELIEIINIASRIFMAECNLCEAEAPIKVIGDIHAQYQHLNKLFDLIGRVPQERFMFLGDYVDRGPQGIEVLVLLFALKIRYPNRIYILRGNHETPSVNKIYGFYNECAQKYGVGLWWDFQACFNRIPMAGLISKKVLCMHGGLSPEITHLDVIRNIPRPCEPLDKGLLIDLLWSDPTNKGDGWFHSIRGISYMFGKGVVAQACTNLGIDLIIRAHQVVQDGYEMMAGRQLITVFSAPNYCNQFTNAAAVVCLDSDLQISFQQLQMQFVPVAGAKPAKAAPAIACSPDPNGAKADKEYIKPFTGFKEKVDKSDKSEKEKSEEKSDKTSSPAPSTATEGGETKPAEETKAGEQTAAPDAAPSPEIPPAAP